MHRTDKIISIVIRTLNEDAYLGELLNGIIDQDLPAAWAVETIIVDSGSTDNTLDIAASFKCRILHIAKQDFTFGRSLNMGCDAADGDYLVIVSGHCVPASKTWLRELVKPIHDGLVDYSYGRQLGRDTTKYSETRVFEKYFPEGSQVPQEGFFTNNANSAIRRTTYRKYRFDEALTGLEDMHLAKHLVEDGGKVGYVAEAAVYHIHNERWRQVRNRYEREAIALFNVLPESHFDILNLFSATCRSIAKDSFRALQAGILLREAFSIVCFRFNQYWGGYKGMRLAKHLARATSKDYFYPDRANVQKIRHDTISNRAVAHEGAQQPSPGQELQADSGEAAISVDAGRPS